MLWHSETIVGPSRGGRLSHVPPVVALPLIHKEVVQGRACPIQRNLLWEVVDGRGCINKNLRKNISSRIKFEVWKL